MKVILNVDAITAPLTGIGRYALELARGLAIHPAITDLRLYSAYQWVEKPEDALRSNRTIALLRRRIPFRTHALELYARGRSALFNFHTRRLDGFLLHTPNYVLMPFDGPAISTVHDLSWLSYPETHPIERVRFLERHLPRTLERATHVLTDSQFVADELVDQLHVPRDKVRVVPLGVDPSFRPYAADDLTPILSRYGLQAGGYTLVVATLEPRKNLMCLARAFAALPTELRQRFPLVIVGGRGWLGKDLGRMLTALEASGGARRLGYVAETDLPMVYAGARAFAFPSLYEGFGLPVLEAMACGVPALTSNASSLPEVAGNAALLVDPLDETAISDGLRKLLDDADWRSSAIAAGLARASEFTWQRCVQNTVSVYQEAFAQT
ncbi:MAG: glycosyltransferase family 1 protein [Dokdonella sp.]